MNLQRPAMKVWQPVTRQDRETVVSELGMVLASHHFCNSKRYPAFLRFVVENALAGRGDELKERTLGVEVFHRPVDYDTNSDTVVRYTAGEVRKRLAVYYHEHESPAGIQIALPTGSYAPEFLRAVEDTAIGIALAEKAGHTVPSPENSVAQRPNPVTHAGPVQGHWWRTGIAVALMALVLASAGIALLRHRPTAAELFWAPTLHEQGRALICSGGVGFANNNFSGTLTAGKETEYPFVSMQIASAISQVSGTLERGGALYEVQAAAFTPLNDMRDRPVVLLGGYNNPWTIRLVAPLRFHFAPEPEAGLLDAEHPGVLWARDRTQSYASTDDYALVTRFRDPTTGSVIVVLAGLGRNGTEVASQFVSSSQYMDQLQAKVGSSLRDRNIEVILKTSVIGGRTGAPTIERVHVW